MDTLTPGGDARLLNNLRHNLGPMIHAALEDPDVVEIMANPDGSVWVERRGVIELAGTIAPTMARIVIGLVADSLNLTATAATPIVEGELPGDGSRFEGLIPPVVAAPSFTIRKKAARVYTLDDYVDGGIMPESVHTALLEAINGRKNMLVIGGTGSGKTTLVNGVIAAIAALCPDDRLVIIEDTAELRSQSSNTLLLRATPYVTIQMLVRATMRLRPDRILVGEVRDGTALDLLKAWNTGHPGGVATIHANSVRGGLRRLESLIGEASAMPMRDLIGEAVDLALFVRRAPDIGRRITQAAWVHDFDAAAHTYSLEMIHNEEKASCALAA